MALFAIMGLDVPHGLSIRAANKPDHSAYIARDISALRLAGALVDGNDAQCGTLMLMEAETEAEVRAWLFEEPYVKAGAYEHLAIRKITINKPWTVPEAQQGDALARIIEAAQG